MSLIINDCASCAVAAVLHVGVPDNYTCPGGRVGVRKEGRHRRVGGPTELTHSQFPKTRTPRKIYGTEFSVLLGRDFLNDKEIHKGL